MYGVMEGLACVFCVMILGVCLAVQGEVSQAEDGQSGTISFKPPSLNDEEAHSLHMPPNLKCDACTAVAYLLTTKFDEKHAKRKKLKKLPESDVYDIIEAVCSLNKDLEQYGVKQVKGVTRLSGPGLEAQDEPGIMQGGGRWPNRMAMMCNAYVEEFDEETIYEVYLKHKGLKKFLCNNKTHEGLTDVCSNINTSETKDEL